MRVFISYSRDDAPGFPAAVREALRRAGHEVWWDEASMSNRGRTFLHEIQSAIDGADQVVLVWGDTAPHKAYVRFEWEHARDAGKVIVPVVIGRRAESLPEELGWCHAVIADAAEPTRCLGHLERVLAERPVELAPLVGVPGLPSRFRPRPAELDRVRRLVLGDKIAPNAIDGPARATVLHGMGGVGKSVLAAAFARSPFARRALEHGIYWLDARGDGDAHALLDRLATLVGVPGATADALREVLAARHVGVVLDDATRAQVDAVLDVLGRSGRVVATTRDASWVAHAGMGIHAVALLSDAEARALLAGWVGTRVDEEALAAELVRLCGGLPLAIALNAGMLLAGWSWARVVDALQRANLTFATGALAGYRHESIDRALEASFRAVSDLGDGAQRRLVELAAFLPEEVPPLAAVARLWRATGGLGAEAAEDLAVRLSLRSLIRLDGDGAARSVVLHDLVRAFLLDHVGDGDRAELDRVLLDAYGPRELLPAVEDDGYVLRAVVRHLLGGGEIEAAHALLTTTDAEGRNAWFARLDEAGLTNAFVADVGRLHRRTAAARAAAGDAAETSALLAREQLYALMTASMAARAARLGPGLLGALAEARLREWPVERVLAYALTLPGTGDRGEAVARIWHLLPERERDRLHRLVGEWIAATPFAHRRARSYAAWLRHLDASAVRAILREVAGQDDDAWREPDSFVDPRYEVDVAGAARLAELGELDEAVDVVAALSHAHDWATPRRDGVRAIADRLTADACRRLLAAEAERPPGERAWPAAIVAGRLAALGHLDEALAVARTVEPAPRSSFPLEGADARVQAYRNVLAPEVAWPLPARADAEREALALLDDQTDYGWGVSAACLAGVLRAQDPAPLVTRVLDLKPARMDRMGYAQEVARFLPEPGRRVALQRWLRRSATQRSVLRGSTRVEYVRWLVPLWSPDHLDELTALVGDDVPLEHRWRFDLAVAARQGGEGGARVLRRAVRDRLTIGDEDRRRPAVDALRGVEPRPDAVEAPLPAEECRARLAEIEGLEEPDERARALGELAPSLGTRWGRVGAAVVAVLSGLPPGTGRAETALDLAAAVPPGERGALVALAAESVRAAAEPREDARPRFPALAARPAITDRASVEALEGSDTFLVHVVATGRHAPTNALRVARLAGALGEGEREPVGEALLAFARSLGHPHRVDVAAAAVRLLPPERRGVVADELSAWARELEDDRYGRAVAHAAAAVADPPALRWGDVRAAIALLDDLGAREQMLVVARLSGHRAPAVFEEVLDAMEAMPNGEARAMALEAAILNAPPVSWERVLRLVAATAWPELELILLYEAATVAPEPLRTRCLALARRALDAIEPATVGRSIRDHAVALLSLFDPCDAAAALGFLWQSAAAHPRAELLELTARTARDARRVDAGLGDALAANVELAARWWP